RAVGLLAARRVAEGDEERLALLVSDEADSLARDSEPHRANAPQVTRGSVAHLDFFYRPAPVRVDGHVEAIRSILGEVMQTLEARTLLDGERRIVSVPEVVVLLAAKLGDFHLWAQRTHGRAHS